MNRTCIFLTAPLAFALAAALAWFTEAPSGNSLTSENTRVRGPRQRAAVGMNAENLTAVLLHYEHKILSCPVASPPVELHDAKGMEASLDADDRSCGFGSGNYASGWAEESPDAMFAWLVQQEGSSFNRKQFSAYILFKAWAKKDMAEALAAVDTIPDRNLHQQALVSSLEVLCQSDPARARELLLQNLSRLPTDGQSPIFAYSDTGERTCDMLLSLPPGEERTHLLAKLLKDMGGRFSAVHEVDGALAAWRNAPESLRRELVAAGFAIDRENAASFEGLGDLLRERAETSGDPKAAEAFIVAQGAAWAKRDLAGVLDWAQTHLPGKSRIERSAELFGLAASEDFDEALRMWQSLPEGFLRVRVAGAIAKGAPANRKADADAVLESLSETQRLWAR
jgi:hypothetical protein